MPLTLLLNGQNRTFDALSKSATIEQLVAELGLKTDRVAVEHNGEIAARARWHETPLSEGDRLEVVHFVGGGLDTGPVEGTLPVSL
ncbi:sulfur carrier protein ThiS [Edaphobacter bradus]|uniref:sulfur carrier protein ThiS n=1 Tax=Edaphobacter bradus TaxID=2259016 RepID=UPI0021E01707|nr:sulfur carrier protein ThiS [Edaphobacter bradus]